MSPARKPDARSRRALRGKASRSVSSSSGSSASNPLAFGMIGSTDTHNGNPGDVEEWDFVGAVGQVTARRRSAGCGSVKPPGARREALPIESAVPHVRRAGRSLGRGEYTRRDLRGDETSRGVRFTSGPRITLRFFAGWGFDESIEGEHDPVAIATAGGVPMGGVLRPAEDDTTEPDVLRVGTRRLDERASPAHSDGQGLDRRGRRDPREGPGHRLRRWPRGRSDHPALPRQRRIGRPDDLRAHGRHRGHGT